MAVSKMNNPIQAVMDAIYPVGSVYMSLNSSMPPLLAAGRTWEAVTGDYVLKTTTTETGGTYNTAGDTGSHTLTIDEIPSHTHVYYGWYGTAQGSRNCPAVDGSTSTYKTRATGGGQGHTHTAGMPQNVAVYMWKRTA